MPLVVRVDARERIAWPRSGNKIDIGMIHRVHGMANGIKERLHEVKSMKPWEQGRIIPLSGSVNHSELGAKTKLFRVCGVRKHPQTNQGLAKGATVGRNNVRKKGKKQKNAAAHAHQLTGPDEKPTRRGKFGIPIFSFFFFSFSDAG